MTSVRQALDLALQHFQRGDSQRAEQLFLQILQADPHQVDALHLLGIIAGQTGRENLAIEYLAAALRLKPDLAGAHNNLGNVFTKQGKLADAIVCYQRALQLRPNYYEAHCNLGNALRAQGRLVEAVANLRQAVQLRPDSPEAHNNLGIAMQALGELGEAMVSYQHAVRLRPDYSEAYLNLGAVLRDQGLLDDALATYRTALQRKTDAARIHSSLILTLHYHPGYDAQAIFEECCRWSRQYADLLKNSILRHFNPPNPERRLRIGYVSPDFVGHHVDCFFTIPLLSNHDHRQFEVFCYADVARPDALTERLRGHADVWRDTVRHSDQQLADLVRSDQIDILIDMKLHTPHNRLGVFARKPAPVQVAWLGYTGTTGLATIDYRLTDPYLDPPGLLDVFYSEASLRLPDTFWCYDPLTDQPPVSSLPALETGVITFGCLNNFCKINDGCLALWARVLEAVPRSRLLLLAPRGRAREHVAARLDQAGIAAPRVEFADRQPRPEYLKLYNRIDLGLDPVPCNGQTTSLDAFWMGVPMITLVSKTTAFGRAGWSQLSNLGLQELAAETPDQYVELAMHLARDLPKLQQLRGTLRQRMLGSPLMDSRRFAGHMEQAYRQMWCRWCEQRKRELPV
jgi:predicted O-linked N-acetylglucosamine transferase (SPINDLY family)